MKPRFVALAALAALAAWPIAIAHAQPAKRKPLPSELPPDAIGKFVAAVLADQDGDLAAAASRYRDANKSSEHAATHYNLADAQRRMEKWQDAVASYRKYLELAPAAPDRAEVERAIAEIEARPGTVVIDGEDPDALVLVDGKLLGRSPVVLQLADGRHRVDRVSRTGVRHRRFEVKRGTVQHITLTTEADGGGNVILASDASSGAWNDLNHRYELNQLLALPPGRHETYFGYRNRACNPIVFDAPKSGEIVYVRIDVGPSVRGCEPLQISQTRLRLAP